MKIFSSSSGFEGHSEFQKESLMWLEPPSQAQKDTWVKSFREKRTVTVRPTSRSQDEQKTGLPAHD